ncbi:MAG TPA: PH domain-containing protein [Roseomonas sp.]
MAGTMTERMVLEVRETRRSFGPLKLVVGILLLGLPFLGRQRVTITDQRIVLEEGFWSRTRDDVEIFRIRDVVVRQSIGQRLFGIGDVLIKSTEGRAEEGHVLRGLPNPVQVAETIRATWNHAARPRGPATTLD